MQIAIVVALILCNGLLSMSEFAVVSSNRTRLVRMADEGRTGARSAVGLVDGPNRFLSTVQIGITLVGILVGTFGGATIADDLAALLRAWPLVAGNAFSVAILIVTGATTYLTLVIGELVPKRLAIRHPERIAALIAPPMRVLAAISYPLVVFLSASTSLVMRLLGQHGETKEEISEEEVTLMIREGQKTGVFRRAEAQMVAGVFRLDDIRADAVMTPRVDVDWIDSDASPEEIRATITRSGHSHYPVCEGEIDRVVGVVDTTAVAKASLSSASLDLRTLLEPAEFVPESADAGELVRHVERSGRRFLVVVSEHGGVDGIVTIRDLAEAVLGDLGEPDARRLSDGSWLVSGAMPVEEVVALIDAEGMREGAAKSYGTLAGFVMDQLGRVPKGGEDVEWQGFRFTVTRLARHRVRTVRIEQIGQATETRTR
jgi:putative hemolysin